eukprot:TRINITY_DN330_c1_g1_i1.p1 TRINITY_DN330_c1_g1~~TRINITY_DN330_c1_g1_i1.p1  ORF type:complete len:276 (+),score=54.64 TRINITY_DN330_c1_g1_i1:122-829(+)
MKKIACWVLDRQEQLAEGVELKLGGKQLSNDATLGGCGVEINSLILADFYQEKAKDARNFIPQPLKMERYWPDPRVANILQIRSFIVEDNALLFEGLGGGIEILISHRLRDWEQLTWQVSYTSDTLAPTSQTYFKIPLAVPESPSLVLLNSLILGRHIWSSESSTDKKFISLVLSERAALTYACCLSELFKLMPQDVYETICSFLPSTARIEISAVNIHGTGMAVPLSGILSADR